MADKKEALDKELSDLALKTARSTIALIDTVTVRGGFRGEELSTIGSLRDQAARMIKIVETIDSKG